MKKISIIALAISALLFFGCSQDYLETSPTGSVKSEMAFKTTEAAAVAVNGLNKIMNRQYSSYGQGYNGEGTVRLYNGEYMGDKLMACNLSSFMNSSNGDLYHAKTASLSGYAWYYYYMLIGNANAILSNIDKAVGTDGERAYLKAQTLCYRAYAYSNLVQLYGRRWSDGQEKPSCVLRLTGEEPDNLDRSSAEDVYKRIYADLDEAISLFDKSGKANSRKEAYMMDLDVAYAIYARVALTREDWGNALKYAQLVRKKYPLMGVNDYKDGFCKSTSEWIWYLFNTSDETLYYYSYFACISYNSNASNVRNHPKLISKHLYDQIPVTDIRRDFWLDPAGYSGTYNTNTNKAKAQKPSNALYKYAFAHASKDDRVGLNNKASVAAYMQFKIRNNENPGVGNQVLFRSSEMLLIEAEANYRLGKEDEARANLVELTATTKRDPAYSCDKTGEDLMKEIKLYRGIELWGEGFTWFDLKRWGDGIDRKAYAKGGNWMTTFAVSYGPGEKSNWTWCIPQSETDYNKGITTTSNY